MKIIESILRIHMFLDIFDKCFGSFTQYFAFFGLLGTSFLQRKILYFFHASRSLSLSSLGKLHETCIMSVDLKLTFFLLLLSFQNQTLVAVKASEASCIEVSDPDEVADVDGWGLKIDALY